MHDESQPVRYSATHAHAIRRRKPGSWWIAIVVVCFFWHLWAAGHYTVFDDEAFSCRRYTLPMGDMIEALWHGAEPDPPLYYILENLCVRLLGVGQVGLRALSIVLFAIGLIAIRTAADAWFDKPTANVALIVCALHPAHLMLGFAARWYSAMFLAVAILLLATAKLSGRATVEIESVGVIVRRVLNWSLCAAAVCYVNYFGPIVVGLIWLAGLTTNRARIGRWSAALALAVVLYLPWSPAYWRILTSFPDVSGGWRSAAASAARTLMALCAGSVASVQAWWVWGPMALCAACAGALLLRYRSHVWGLTIIVIGCIIAGAASRTMLDKYVMSFSGIVCILIAALLRRGWAEAGRDRRLAAVVATVALATAWIGCGINIARGENWASLRWHDPFEEVIHDLLDDSTLPPVDQWVMGHPSAWYYFGIETLRRDKPASVNMFGGGYVDGALWRRLAVPGSESGDSRLPLTADIMLSRMQLSPPTNIVTIETADFAESPAWHKLIENLHDSYFVVAEQQYLHDRDFALKDRLDPKFRHPPWRMTVRHWRQIPASWSKSP